MEIIMKPVGYIKSEYTVDNRPPTQSVLNNEAFAEIEILEEYKDAMYSLKSGDYIVVLFNFHKSEGYELKHYPHGSKELKGLFSTRTPRRPNGIGMSIVQIEKVEDNVITIKGVDMLDGTPVLDIKPYNPGLNPEG